MKKMLQTLYIGSILRAPWLNGPIKNKHLEQHETRRPIRRKRHVQ